MQHALLLGLLLAGAAAQPAPQPFIITVVDAQTGRGVPLVELRTVNHVRYVTDSNGIAAFAEPGLMNQKVFFHVRSHGYEFPKDGFGYRGRALRVVPGGSGRLKIKRVNIAQRLYRVTGGGIYRDTRLAGKRPPLKQPLLAARVFGSDSVVSAVYRGRIYWFWGDTNRPSYPLGNFHVPGATSLLSGQGGLDPHLGVDLRYFVGPDGFAKPTAQMPGDGPTWIDALVVVPDAAGKQRLMAAYVKVRKGLKIYRRGLVQFNDQKQRFDRVADFDLAAPLLPTGHPFTRRNKEAAKVYFADPYPLVRAAATTRSLADLSQYEAFTCLKQGTKAADGQLDRDEKGTLRYRWKKNTPPLRPAQQAALIRTGRMKPQEALLLLRDVESGKAVSAHRGSVYWNAYRNRWVMIACQSMGTSFLGEIWYSEAPTPLGPWVYARKIVTHDKYSFYNPKQHPFFDQHGGREIFFEGTYTTTFSGNTDPTPRYDYNQIMYKLDLSDPRTAIPGPLYRIGSRLVRADELPRDPAEAKIAFFAPRSRAAGTLPIYVKAGRLTVNKPAGDDQPPLMFAWPADAKQPPATTVPLYEYRRRDGKSWIYSTQADMPTADYTRSERPVGRVWRNPLSPSLAADILRGGEPTARP